MTNKTCNYCYEMTTLLVVVHSKIPMDSRHELKLVAAGDLEHIT